MEVTLIHSGSVWEFTIVDLASRRDRQLRTGLTEILTPMPAVDRFQSLGGMVSARSGRNGYRLNHFDMVPRQDVELQQQPVLAAVLLMGNADTIDIIPVQHVINLRGRDAHVIDHQ